MIQKQDDAIGAILAHWDSAGLQMPKRQRELIDIAGRTSNALADSVIDRVNAELARTRPDKDGSRLLAEIDAYYVQSAAWQKLSRRSPRRRTGMPRSRIVEVIQLISPLVYFDEIIAMASLDDAFLSRMELAFLSRIDVPRDVKEAERVYAKILELPKRFERKSAMGKLESDQPFRAQMFFASFLWRETDPGSELWRFQKHCLESCPDYLLDVPERSMSLDRSSRPAFWMGLINDPEFQEILLKRGSKEVRDSINRNREYGRKVEASASAVRSDSSSVAPPVTQRVSTEQENLAALLTACKEAVTRDLPNLVGEFKKPIHDDQIDKLNRAIHPLRITEDVETLYKWCNGLGSATNIFGYPDFVSIELALHEYRQLAEVLADSWSRAWFPLFGTGRSFRLTLLAEDYAPSTPVFRYDIEDGELTLEYESLESMVQTYKDAYDAGFANWDDSVEYFKFDEDALEALRLESNPRAYAYPDKIQNAYNVFEPDSWPPLWQKYKT